MGFPKWSQEAGRHSISAQLQDGFGGMGSRGVASAGRAVAQHETFADAASFLPVAVHWDLAVHHPGLPSAHHGPVLLGVHTGEPSAVYHGGAGRVTWPVDLAHSAWSGDCQQLWAGRPSLPATWGVAVLDSGQCVLALEQAGVPPGGDTTHYCSGTRSWVHGGQGSPVVWGRRAQTAGGEWPPGGWAEGPVARFPGLEHHLL